MLGSGHWWFPIKYEAVGSQARLFSDEALGAPWGHLWFPIPSISLNILDINISGCRYHQYPIREKRPPCYSNSIQHDSWMEFKTTNCLHGGIMVFTWGPNGVPAGWEPHVSIQFLSASILEAGWPIKPFNQWFCTSVIVGGPTQIISLPGLNR